MLESFLEKLTHNNETKPFWATSEFYAFIGLEVTAAADWLPTHDPKVRTFVLGIAAAAYKLSRGLSKSGVPPTKV